MLDRYKRVFIVGIKGVALTNCAVILTKMGKFVSGSDTNKQFITDPLLKKYKIVMRRGFDLKDVPIDSDLILYSAAHLGSRNPQVTYARKNNIKALHQAEFIGQLLTYFKKSIAVCGTHGKTTTTSLLVHALKKLGTHPSYLDGAPFFDQYEGADFDPDKRDYFVIEADEYALDPPVNKTPKFFTLSPRYIICTNIDFDHPDVYKNLEETSSAFFKFFDQKKLILCADDQPTVQLINRLKSNQYETYGFSPSSDLGIKNDTVVGQQTQFELCYKGNGLGMFTISLFGKKNVSNAAAVVLQLLHLHFTPQDIRMALTNFSGAKRRFEEVYEHKNTHLFDDYGHHPAEIEATINAARARFPDRRVIVIFQPHTYSRTKMFQKQFVSALKKADEYFIVPTFSSARESAEGQKQDILPVISIAKLDTELSRTIKPGDIIFTMGAGDVYKLKDKLIAHINSL